MSELWRDIIEGAFIGGMAGLIGILWLDVRELRHALRQPSRDEIRERDRQQIWAMGGRPIDHSDPYLSNVTKPKRRAF